MTIKEVKAQLQTQIDQLQAKLRALSFLPNDTLIEPLWGVMEWFGTGEWSVKLGAVEALRFHVVGSEDEAREVAMSLLKAEGSRVVRVELAPVVFGNK